MGDALVAKLVLCFAGCFSAYLVAGQGRREPEHFRWPVWEVPNPHSLDAEQYQACGRANASSVCDPNGLIPSYQADQIDRLISEVYRNTTCQCLDCRINNHGYVIRVAILPRMERLFPESGNSSRARLMDAKMYSYILTRRWQMNGACNETLLILYSKHDDILFTLTRPMARRRLTDNDVTRISVAVKHFFDDDETIADGIMEMIQRYRLVFLGRLTDAFLPSSGSRRG